MKKILVYITKRVLFVFLSLDKFIMEGRRMPRRLRVAGNSTSKITSKITPKTTPKITYEAEHEEDLSNIMEHFRISHDTNAYGESKENSYYLDPRLGCIVEESILHHTYKMRALAKTMDVIPVRTVDFISYTEELKRKYFLFTAATYKSDELLTVEVNYYPSIDHSFALDKNFSAGYEIKNNGTHKLDPIPFIKHILQEDAPNQHLRDSGHPKFIGGYKAKYDTCPANKLYDAYSTAYSSTYSPTSPRLFAGPFHGVREPESPEYGYVN